MGSEGQKTALDNMFKDATAMAGEYSGKPGYGDTPKTIFFHQTFFTPYTNDDFKNGIT